MLYKSGFNLEEGPIDFISNNESITLFSAYIKLEELQRINFKNNIKQIIVRWEIEDLCKGVSDIELYHYCLDNGIALYRNTRLHMKAIWNNLDIVFFGSANVTGRGLGQKNNYNFELNGIKESIDFTDIIYFNQVITNSEYVTSDLYNKLYDIVNNTILPVITFPEIPTTKKEIDYFLLSQLPMSKSPDDLYELVVHFEDFDYLEQNFAAHDVALYNINSIKDYILFKSELKNKFNSHPFIIALKEHIISQPTKSLRYGGVVEWIQINTTTVPTPRRWELKQDKLVNVLYSWICEFDDSFTWDTPNHSEVIYFNS
ncbi:MAG: hypothetical protein K9I82_16520 [Chitinophagaceae bacterium]|nr:hypothetical protein [Chitinophagaceae bacterium]